MMMEKQAASKLAAEVLSANPKNTVGYISFTELTYPSLCSGGFMGVDQQDELMAIINKTEGHDYTNYIHALWTAKQYIENRTTEHPMYIVFISDGMPNKSAYSTKEWNILDLPNQETGGDGDLIGFHAINAGEAESGHNNYAKFVADCLKDWYLDKYGSAMDMFTIGINTNNAANEMLAAIASDADHFLYCDDPSELGTIINAASVNTYPSGTLTDVIGEDFDLIVDAEHPFTVAGKAYETAEAADADDKIDINADTISWTLNEVDETGVRITFYVKLDTEKLNNENAEDLRYDTNEYAELEYVDLNTNDSEVVELPTPYVCTGYDVPSPGTITFENGDASNISFMLIDKETGNVEFLYKTDIENETSFEIPFEAGKVSAVFVKQSTSGMFWFSEEVDEDVVDAAIACLKANNPSYKGHNAVAFGAGSHELKYSVGNGKKNKEKTVTYTFEIAE